MNYFQENLRFCSTFLSTEQVSNLKQISLSSHSTDSDFNFHKFKDSEVFKPLIALGRAKNSDLGFFKSQSLKNMANVLIDKHDKNLFSTLPLPLDENDHILDSCSGFLAKDYLFFGGSSFLSSFNPDFFDNLKLVEPFTFNSLNCSSICICFDTLKEFSAFLSFIPLDSLVTYCKSESIGLNIIVAETSEALKRKISVHYASLMPTCLYGLKLILPKQASSVFLDCYSYLTDRVAFGRLVLGEFGTSSDELNQLLQSLYKNIKNDNKYLSCSTTSSHFSEDSIVVVGGGPSLDDNIDYLQALSDKGFAIVAAGSCIGTLLKNNINVAAVILLERGSSVYHSCQELSNQGYDLSNIPLIASYTIDPRASTLFGQVIYFHRPLSVTANFFEEIASKSSLYISGPEAINAAVEVLMKCGFNDIYAIGCDFGSPSATSYRSDGAIGSSPRSMDLLQKSNKNRSIFTEELLMSSHSCLEAVLKTNPHVKFRRYGEGVKIDSAFVDTFEKFDFVPSNLITQQLFAAKLQKCVFTTEPTSLDDSIDGMILALSVFSDTLKKTFDPNYPWDITNHRQLSLILENGLQFSENVDSNVSSAVNALMRAPLFTMFSYLYDVSSDSKSYGKVYERIISRLDFGCSFYSSCLSLIRSYSDSHSEWCPDEFIRFFHSHY